MSTSGVQAKVHTVCCGLQVVIATHDSNRALNRRKAQHCLGTLCKGVVDGSWQLQEE